MFDERFAAAVPILDTIESRGYQAYFVGGSVRNYILQLPIHDLDIATSAPPTVIQSLFQHVIPVGIEHGTVIVRYQHQSYEVTTFRTESGYSDKRHPDQVVFVDDLQVDLSRRDFTMNALAMDKSGTMYDPFDGKKDIYNQRIRTVGDPHERFSEDPLRMMRALRFSSQLGFTIETNTMDAIASSIEWLESLAVERLAIELEKLFAGSHFKQAIRLASKVKLWSHLPVFCHNSMISNKLTKLTRPLPHLYELFAYLVLINQVQDIKWLVKKWKQSNQTYLTAAHLVTMIQLYQQDGLNKWLVYQLKPTLYSSFIRLIHILFEKEIGFDQIKSIKSNLIIQNRKEIAFNGSNLIALYPDRNKGQWISSYLQELEYAIVTNQLENNYQVIKEWFIQWHPPETS